MFIASLVGAVVGAVGFRVRGAASFDRVWDRLFPFASALGGATTARIAAWAVPMSFLAYLFGASPLLAVALGFALWLGCLPPWPKSFDLGRREGTWKRDAPLQAGRGILWSLPAGVVFMAANPAGPLPGILVALSGASALPAYEFGHRWRPEGSRAPGATEVGEVLLGAAIGAAVLAATVWISP